MKPVYNRLALMKYLLKIGWILLTLFSLSLAAYFHWNYDHLRFEYEIQEDAHKRVFYFDDFIEKILDTLNHIPYNTQDFLKCDALIENQLGTLLFHNPAISGIFVKNKKNLHYCHSLGPIHQDFPIFSDKTPFLYGPILIQGKAVMVLGKELGDNQYRLFILKQVLDDLLYLNEESPYLSIAIYSRIDHKTVLQAHPEALVDEDQPPSSFTMPLQMLDDYDMIFYPKTFTITRSFILQQIIYSLSLIFILCILYVCLNQFLSHRISLRYILKTGLKHKQFIPVYQLIHNTRNNQYCGAEVLMRWQFNEEIIEAEFFIEEAESSGLITPMTLQLIEKSLKDFSPILKQKSFYLSYNISPRQLEDDEFFHTFYRLIAQYQVPEKNIMIEITERHLLDKHNQMVMARLAEMRTYGFSLAVDDFGTGHANIEYLYEFPFNYLKIDKMFIQAIGSGAVTENLFQSIVNMTQKLPIKIIAEGVETQKQSESLIQAGVHFHQGWYYVKAMPFNLLKKYL